MQMGVNYVPGKRNDSKRRKAANELSRYNLESADKADY